MDLDYQTKGLGLFIHVSVVELFLVDEVTIYEPILL